MKILCFLMLVWLIQVKGEAYSQSQLVTLQLKNCNVEEFLQEVKNQTGIRFMYQSEFVREIPRFNLDVRQKRLDEVLKQVFTGQGIRWRFEDEVVILMKEQAEKKTRQIRGTVRDVHGNGLPGVTVRLKGVPIGTLTNAEGKYFLELPAGDYILVFTMVGMSDREEKVGDRHTIDVTLLEAVLQLEEAIATGIINKPKESFTGSVTSVTKEDIKVHYSRNLIQTLANIDPSLRIVQDNEAGSDPNAMPVIQLRGASTMLNLSDLENQTARPEYNQPLFVMDGFEVDLERVMDLNENEIESINILKDASATSLYGSRGANGVIVITTNRYQPGNLRVMYEGRINLQLPDFSTYDNLMTAREKFETEKIYGVWENRTEYYEEVYRQIQENIDRGVDYDWLKLPTRKGIGQTHMLQVMGGAEGWTYGLNLSYQSTIGVMKGSERTNFNGGMNLGYRKNKWNIRQNLSVATNTNRDSPYGDFWNYVNMNPYWEPYDENGEIIDDYYHPKSSYGPVENPLYNKKVGVWNKTKYLYLKSNTQLRYDILPGFQTTATFGISRKSTTGNTFYPPSHKNFENLTELDQKGSYSTGERNVTEWQVRGTLNYANTFKDKHMLTLAVSGELSEAQDDAVYWTASGFVADNIDHPGMSLGYPDNGHASGNKSLTRRVGILASANYYYDSRYFLDASITYNGASSFGRESRFSPYYSLGCGWMASNEHFIRNSLPFIDELRLRYSVGVAGNMTLQPSQYMEVFDRHSTDLYLGGICWTLNSFANSELKQQNTIQHNAGFDLGLFKKRLTVSFNYYNKLTDNTLIDMSLPISHGFERVMGNVGKIRNEGFEWYLSLNVYQNKEKKLSWYVNANITKNRNTVVKLSEGFKKRAEGSFKSMSTYTDFIKYQEGRSLDAIYGLRTAGVDPTSGQRVFLKKDGKTTTLEQTSDDLVYLGDRQPKLNSTLNTTLSWGGFSLSVGFGVKWGGKQVNQTELTKGENVNLLYNLDRRVSKYSWSKPGDMARYKSKYGTSGNISTFVCDAFVQKDNVFSCNNINLRYQFSQKWLRKTIGLEALSVSASLSDIFYFSTIERERGLDYPFSINPNFSISCTF